VTPSEVPQPVAASTYPDDLRGLVDSYLATIRFSAIPETAGIEEAMRYSLLAGGKRIRPVLALATARSLGMEPDAVLPAAGALELIHTYSLIHDDLPAMDDDALRRGRPTSHVVYGENVAILAGDGLFAEAVRLFCERQEGDPPAVLSALSELLAAIGVDGMVGGQYIDVTTEKPAVSAAPGEGDAQPADPAPPGAAGSQADFLRRLHALKTGRLIAASVGVVLALRALSEPETIPYRRFAEELGVLFQIVDDILDVTGSDEELGKPHGSDERHGKLTYVSLFGLDEARKLASESHRKAHDALAAVDGDPRDLSQITDFIYTRQS
jgi:geranylgeranyl diphosphate synthase type II